MNEPLNRKCLTGWFKPSYLTPLAAVSFYTALNLLLWGWGVKGKDHFHFDPLHVLGSSQLIYPIPIPGRREWGDWPHTRSHQESYTLKEIDCEGCSGGADLLDNNILTQ